MESSILHLSCSQGVSSFNTNCNKRPISCIPLCCCRFQDSRQSKSGGRNGSWSASGGFDSRWCALVKKERSGWVHAGYLSQGESCTQGGGVPPGFRPLQFLRDLGLTAHSFRATPAFRWAAAAGLGVLGWHTLFGGASAWASTGAAVGTDQIGGLLDDGSDFQSGFASAFLLIFFSELGDKTFFIAALLAARKSSAPVFLGTFGALAAMTLISVALGRGFHYADEVLPFGIGQTQLPLDDLAAVVLLIYFGVTTLVSAASMDDSGLGEEQQEAELAIASVDDSGLGVGALQAVAGTVAGTFALVFVAEWGDKSFFSTIALAAASDPLGVVSGAIAGHGVATLLAVLGGSFLSNYLSERVIAYTGGGLFLVFAALTLVDVSHRQL